MQIPLDSGPSVSHLPTPTLLLSDLDLDMRHCMHGVREFVSVDSARKGEVGLRSEGIPVSTPPLPLLSWETSHQEKEDIQIGIFLIDFKSNVMWGHLCVSVS